MFAIAERGAISPGIGLFEYNSFLVFGEAYYRHSVGKFISGVYGFTVALVSGFVLLMLVGGVDFSRGTGIIGQNIRRRRIGSA